MISHRPIHATQHYFVKLLDDLLAAAQPSGLWIGESTVGHALTGDPAPLILDYPRLLIMLAGRQKYAFSNEGRRVEAVLLPGQALYWGRHAWTLGFWDDPCVFMGIAFQRKFVRFLMVDHPGGFRPVDPTPWGYHTRHPLSEPGTQILWALDALAGRKPNAATEHLFSALLCLSRDHLQQDEGDTEYYAGKASWTWRRVQEYLHENYAQPVTRDSVARSLGLHPNYLSALCAKEGGVSFHQTLETIRIERAQHLLRHADLDLERIAQLCGFSSTAHFAKTFRRATSTTPGRYRARQQ